MKIYKISQETNNDYDTYDSAIVAAASEEDAQRTFPSEYYEWGSGDETYFVYADGSKKKKDKGYTGWCAKVADVQVEYVGEAKPETKAGVILASFNAG